MGLLYSLARILAWVLIVLVILGTLLPLLPSSQWYVRVWDYPRLQMFYLALIAIILYALFIYRKHKWSNFLLVALLGVMVYQAYKAYPYTSLAAKQVLQAEAGPQDADRLSLLVSNVLQKNKAYGELLHLIEKEQPDLVITLESDTAWEKALSLLKVSYPHFVGVPLSNTYGMHLYSRRPLADTKIIYLVEADIPSVETKVQLRSGAWVKLFAVHPRPPVPGESNDSRERDAEIVMIGKKAKAAKGGVIVAGDFNDVAWSPSTELFQEVSGLLDPRLGRGYYNTFHAQVPVFRWPLDHVFHSSHFKLVHMKLLPDIGSDHFPILIELSYEPEEEAEQTKPKADKDTAEDAEKTIEKGFEDKDAAGE